MTRRILEVRRGESPALAWAFACLPHLPADDALRHLAAGDPTEAGVPPLAEAGTPAEPQ